MENPVNPEIDEVEVEVDVRDKAEKIEQEKQELLRKVLSGNLETKHDQVGFILNNNSAARNSDIELAWLYWLTFENDLFNGDYVTKNDLKKLTKIASLTRSRARIQNEYKLFQANDKVKRYRGVLAAEMKEEAIDEKPEGLPMYSIYIDETGKTQDFLSVGSLWVIDGLATFLGNREIKAWVDEKNIDFEFHFTKVNRNRLDLYKEFFLKFLILNPTVGFKIIVIDNSGIRDISGAITDLTFHLINKGIKHENETGRAPLPRLLQTWLDEEERGSDQLKIENLKERLSSQQIDGLYLGDFFAVDSKDNFNIQAVDLFTAAVNRKIHNPNSQGNIKDELANYILELLNFDVNSIDLNNSETDKSAVFNLSYRE